LLETLIITLPLMLSPGPANLVSLVLASRCGFWSLLTFQAGIVLVCASTCLVLGAGAAQIGDSFTVPAIGIQLAGGAFIVYLGVRLMIPAKQEGAQTPPTSPTMFNGILLQCLNPKFPVVVLTLLSARASESALVTCSIIIGCGIAGMLLYSTAGAIVHRFAAQQRRYRTLDIISGLLLCATGLWIIFQGVFAIFNLPLQTATGAVVP